MADRCQSQTQNKQFDHDVEMKMDVKMGHNDGGTIANATREIMENQLDENRVDVKYKKKN